MLVRGQIASHALPSPAAPPPPKPPPPPKTSAEATTKAAASAAAPVITTGHGAADDRAADFPKDDIADCIAKVAAPTAIAPTPAASAHHRKDKEKEYDRAPHKQAKWKAAIALAGLCVSSDLPCLVFWKN